jgi:ABC-type uncharacterized transport system substrate-binding protein
MCAALSEAKMFDHQEQIAEFNKKDYLETSSMVIQKSWMDTKRKYSKEEIAQSVERIISDIAAFNPDIILLGDDNAANYIGNQFIDTGIPIVFWGINGLPVKYGLLESVERPGHNVTGVYQAGYLKENVEYLKKLVPGIKTMAVLSDDSETGRSKAKELEQLAKENQLPVEIMAVVITNSFSEWKQEALKLGKEADSFFILNHNTLKDDKGKPVDQMQVGRWYLENIKKPDCAHEKQFAKEGILLVVDDSGYKQAFEAMHIGLSILKDGRNPADIPVQAPARGPIIINRQRAKMLGINTNQYDFIEEYIDRAMALEP